MQNRSALGVDGSWRHAFIYDAACAGKILSKGLKDGYHLRPIDSALLKMASVEAYDLVLDKDVFVSVSYTHLTLPTILRV